LQQHAGHGEVVFEKDRAFRIVERQQEPTATRCRFAQKGENAATTAGGYSER